MKIDFKNIKDINKTTWINRYSDMLGEDMDIITSIYPIGNNNTNFTYIISRKECYYERTYN